MDPEECVKLDKEIAVVSELSKKTNLSPVSSAAASPSDSFGSELGVYRGELRVILRFVLRARTGGWPRFRR